MKYTLLARILIVLTLLSATVVGALAASTGVTPVRTGVMAYSFIPPTPRESLERDYTDLKAEVYKAEVAVAAIREEITAKINQHDSIDSFASISERLNDQRGEILPLLPKIENRRLFAEEVRAYDYQDLFFLLAEYDNIVLKQITAEEARIVQYRQHLQIESDIHALEERYNQAENEYKELKKKLEEALKDGDSADVNRYKNKLRDLQRELDIILDDLQGLFLKLVQWNAMKYNADAQAVKSDVKDLQNKIDDLLKLKKVDRKRGNNSANTVVEAPEVTSGTEANVVVKQLDFLPQNEAMNTGVEDTGAGFSQMLWLIAGNIILLAVIIFLVLLMV